MKKLSSGYLIIALTIYINFVYGDLMQHQVKIFDNNVCSPGVEKSIKREYQSYVTVLTNILNDYEKLTNSGVTISCQIDLRMIIGNFTKSLDSNILTIVKEINSALVAVEKFIPVEIDIVSAIRKGDSCAARFQILENGKLSLVDLIPNVYDKNLTYAGKLVEFLNALPELDDTIFGYRLLLDEMKKNGHLYSTVTSSMAYQILNVFHKTHKTNEHFIYARDNLPESLKTFTWNNFVVFSNKLNNEPLFSHVDYDAFRRTTFSYVSACAAVHCQWKFIPIHNGTLVNIKNNQYNEYLYADLDELSHDNQRRRVFTWKTKDESLDKGNWQIEPVEGSEYFKIKNMYWNEYMYADTIKYAADGNCRHIFTWRPGGCVVDGCQWKLTRV